MIEEPLGVWGRVGVVGLACSVILCTAFMVACFVVKGCVIHDWYFLDRKRRRDFSEEDDKLFIPNPPKHSYVKESTGILSSKIQPTISYTQGTPGAIQVKKFDPLSPHGAAPYLEAPAESGALLGALNAKRDSTYSSMSENSGRTSPTLSLKSSAEGSIGSAAGSVVGSPTGGDAQGQVNFTLQFTLTNKDRTVGKLIISIQEVRGLHGRQYMGGACDPYVKVIIWRERRSLRKVKSPPLHVFRTRTVRHTTDPTFNQSFVLEISKNDLKDTVVKIITMDSDKWVSPTTLGEVVVPLRDLKGLVTNPEKTPLHFFLAPAKTDLGEVLFGLSYLPTAQRLSVSVIKASHLKYQHVVDDITDFCPFIRVLLVSQSGRVLRKKKTTFRAKTDKPVWNETLIFDLMHHQIEHVTFILAICTRPQPITATDQTSPPVHRVDATDRNGRAGTGTPGTGTPGTGPEEVHEKKQDKYLGKVILGCNIPDGLERQHWFSVLSSPRRIVSQWQTLK